MQKALKSRNINRCGFSLIEVMIAVAVFSIALLGMTAMMITAVQTTNYSKNRTVAVTLARDRMESLKRKAMTIALTSTADDSQEQNINRSGQIITECNAACSVCSPSSKQDECFFSRGVAIEDPLGATVLIGDGILVNIDVQITWTDFRSHTLTQTSFISQ